ncbi:MAG: fibronectin type III domain-containing protein [Actinomycetota bacterium]|nr:fibronectin type III domain-containing protein [Actinomycetota bacterium]
MSTNAHTVTVAAPATAPGAPTGVTATAGDGEATISWAAPAEDGGAAITSYTVTCATADPGDCAGVDDTATADGVTTSATVTGLTNGTDYTFTVTATNSAGTSAASAASPTVTPAAEPEPDPPATKTPQTITFGDLRERLLVGQDPYQVPVTASSALPVTLTASGSCSASGRLVTATAAGTCTITANQPGDATYAAAPPEVATITVAAASDAELTVDTALGSGADGAPIVYRANGLAPGSTVTLTLYSDPVELASATVPASGSIVIEATIPAGVDVGDHELVATATAADGAPLTNALAIEIAANRSLVRIGDDALPTLAATGTNVPELIPFALAAILAGVALTHRSRRPRTR